MKTLLFVALISAFGAPLAASAPDASPRPQARGQVDTALSLPEQRPQVRPVLAAFVSAAPQTPARPHIRPQSQQEKLMTAPEATVILASVSRVGLAQSLRPALRPKGLEQKVMAQKRKRAKGAICGDPDLQGDVVGHVPGRIRGCGVENAVRVRSVSGVALSQAAIMDCGTAKALKSWVEKGLKPSIGQRGGGVARIKVAAHYACRTRNNKRGAKISEHGKGRAIDIAGFTLRDGSNMTVLQGWRSAKDGKPLKSMHRAACGPFGTVLGPNADRYHQDHFHFDTARYRSGRYCR